MADDRLSWVFELFDRISGPASSMSSRLEMLERRMVGSGREVDSFGSKVASTGSKILSMGAGLGGWVSAISAAGNVLKSIGGTVFNWGKTAVDALAFRESTLTSFQTMLGTKKAADELFADATLMARTTPFDTKDVVESYKTLLTAGFNKEEIPIVFQAVGDQAAAMGMKKEIIGQLALVFGQIKAQGRVMGNDLIQLSNAGVGRDAFMTNLAKRMGISKEGARAALSSGAIGADQAIVAILDTIAKKAGGGTIGGGMEAQSHTLSGLFSNLESVLDDAFFAFDKMEDMPGLNAFKGTIENLIKLFDLTTDSGKAFKLQLQMVFEDTFGSIFKSFSGPKGMDNLHKGFTVLLDLVHQGWDAVKGIGRGFEALWKALEPALASFAPMDGDAANLATTGERIGKAFEKAGGAVGRMAASLIELMDRADRSNFFNGLMYLTGASTSNGVSMGAVGGRAALPGEVGYDPDKDPNKGFGAYLRNLLGLDGGTGTPNVRPQVNITVPLQVNGNAKPEAVQKAATAGVETAAAHLEKLATQKGVR
jgi:tape measure domain-containing protein